MITIPKIAIVANIFLIGAHSLKGEQFDVEGIKNRILTKTIQVLRPFENIQLSYAIQEKDEKGHWNLVERIKVTRNLSGTKQKYSSVVNGNGVFSQKLETYDGNKYMLIDRVVAHNPELNHSVKYLEGGSGVVTTSKLERAEPYLQVYQGAFGIGLISDILKDPAVKITPEEISDALAEKYIKLRINRNLRLVINRNTGEIIEGATEAVDNEGKVYDDSNLVVDKSILVDGRQVPISFSIKYGSGMMRRYEIDPNSIKFNSDLKSELFELKFPYGCSVIDKINQKSYTVTGLDTQEETESLIDAINRSLVNPK